MPRAAVALAPTDLEQQLVKLGRPLRPRRTMSRRAWIAIAVIAIVSVWLTFVFGKTLSDVNKATARHQVVATEAATLQARLDADRREQALVQTDAFQRLQARAYG